MVGDIVESSPPEEFEDEVPSWLLEGREMRCWNVSDMRISTLRSAISAR